MSKYSCLLPSVKVARLICPSAGCELRSDFPLVVMDLHGSKHTHPPMDPLLWPEAHIARQLARARGAVCDHRREELL